MKKHRFRLLCLGGGLGLAALGALGLALAFRPGVTRENYQRVQQGMTLEQVQGVLGGPPGNYSRLPDKEAGLWALDADRPDLNREFFIGREVWVGNELAVAVWFDDQDRVVRKESYDMPGRGFLEWFRELFPW